MTEDGGRSYKRKETSSVVFNDDGGRSILGTEDVTSSVDSGPANPTPTDEHLRRVAKARRGQTAIAPARKLVWLLSYCENIGQDCQVREWWAYLKTWDGAVEIRPETLRCPVCCKHSANWVEVYVGS